MALPQPHVLETTATEIRRAVRRLRWFKQSFAEQVEAISRDSGVRYTIHDDRLTRVFVDWLRAFDAQKPASDQARRDYVGFASGLMLRQLVADRPLSVDQVPVGSDASNPAYYWPEGYVYVAYCLNVRSAVLAQDFDEMVALAPDLADIRTWWSFKENVAEDASLAIAFLDLFSGDAPNWSDPAQFYAERPLVPGPQ